MTRCASRHLFRHETITVIVVASGSLLYGSYSANASSWQRISGSFVVRNPSLPCWRYDVTAWLEPSRSGSRATRQSVHCRSGASMPSLPRRSALFLNRVMLLSAPFLSSRLLSLATISYCRLFAVVAVHLSSHTVSMSAHRFLGAFGHLQLRLSPRTFLFFLARAPCMQQTVDDSLPQLQIEYAVKVDGHLWPALQRHLSLNSGLAMTWA